jgi:methylated-DNA-[protein]-cysteine S-methyltransferase
MPGASVVRTATVERGDPSDPIHKRNRSTGSRINLNLQNGAHPMNSPAPPTDEGLATQLAAALDPQPETLRRLGSGLAQHAAAEELLDVAIRYVDSPFGALLMAVTPAGVVRVAFALEGFDQVLADLATSISPRVLESSAATEAGARQLDEYFTGRRHSFDIAVDLRLIGGFRRRVVEALPTIAYGETSSYAGLAAKIGSPSAVRAVGTACAKNPIPLILPCHRVVRSDGTIGNYLGGIETKRALLEMETSGPAENR